MSDTITAPITSPSDVTQEHLNDVRDIVKEALNFYADHAPATAAEKRVAGVAARDLARNVQGWTHTTRLREFIASGGKGGR